MKDLIQHIENLLPEHDCVVVPGLGGFVQNEVQARIQPGARLFYPASKEIGFNPRLKFNDGLLAQSYQETKGLSFEEANASIQSAVLEIQDKLEAGKFIRLGRTGTLFMIDKQLIFRPDHHNHFFPEAYGLTPFTSPLLNKQSATESVPVHAAHAEQEREVEHELIAAKTDPKSKSSRDEFIHIRFSRSRVRQLIAGTAVFLFLILFAKPAGKPSGNQEAGMLHNYLTVSSKSVPVAAQDETTIVPVKDTTLADPQTHASVPTPGVQKDATAPTAVTAQNAVPNTYYIIVSAFFQKASAKRWIAEHEGESIVKDAGIVVGDGHARVYVKNFNSEQDANQFLAEFTASHSEYASAWVYSLKND